MKLTPDMFDFEKYDYFDYLFVPDGVIEEATATGWGVAGVGGGGLYRKLKEPTYYRLHVRANYECPRVPKMIFDDPVDAFTKAVRLRHEEQIFFAKVRLLAQWRHYKDIQKRYGMEASITPRKCAERAAELRHWEYLRCIIP